MLVDYFDGFRKNTDLAKLGNTLSHIGKSCFNTCLYRLRIEVGTIRKLYTFFEMESVGQAIVADVPCFGKPALKFTAFTNNKRIIAVTGIIGKSHRSVGTARR